MSKFKDLIISLRAYTIVIIEDEFTLIHNPIKLLAYFCLCEQSVSDRIYNELMGKELNDAAEMLNELKANFLKLEQDADLINKIPALDNFEHYLERIKGESILKQFDLKKFENILGTDDINFIKSTFLKYGAINTYKEEHYKEIIEEIKEIKNTEMLIFNQAPAPQTYGDFIETIKHSVSLTNSNFYLCLIDKSLGNGEDSAGREFALKDLKILNKQNHLNYICFIYTTRPTEGEKPPRKLKHYYAQEIKKSSPPDFDYITQVLAQSAYATVFEDIRKNTKGSAKKTLNAVLKNQKNIKYIVDKSHHEGISPYDSIKYWYNLLLQKSFEENEIANYSYAATLSSFFKNEFLDDHPNMSDISEDMSDLNNYELFDSKVNDKLLPIAPGDIWYSDGNYYILMGQLCDMLIRRKDDITGKLNTRNGKIGELLKLSFDKIDHRKDKYYIEFNNNKKFVYIQNFIDIHGQHQKLKIDVSTPNIYFTELRVLDLAMFNLDGECRLNINKELDPGIINMLYENKNIYFESLQKRYKNLGFNNMAQIITVLDEDNPIKFGATGFIFDNEIVDYRLKRVSRLKGRYYDSLYNNFINNKGRIDLNLIDNYAIKSKKINLKCQIGNLADTVEEIETVIYSDKEQHYFLKKDLLSKLSGNYSDLLNMLDERVNPSDKNHFSFTDDETYELIFLIKFDSKSIDKEKNTFDYRQLFKANHTKYKTLKYFITGIQGKMISFDGNPVSLDNLRAGVEIPVTKEKIILSNGIITINNTE